MRRLFPTLNIKANDVLELSAGFVRIGALLAVVALLLAQVWRPLP